VQAFFHKLIELTDLQAGSPAANVSRETIWNPPARLRTLIQFSAKESRNYDFSRASGGYRLRA
jgi:hypothetical protein